MMNKEIELSFEQWICENEEEINIQLAESGADRELDFDIEKEYENRYEKYLNNANQL